MAASDRPSSPHMVAAVRRKSCEGDIINSLSSGSLVLWGARVSKKASVGRAVHQSAALLTDYATSRYFGHGNFVFRSAAALMRPCEPFYKFGHARNVSCGSKAAIFRVCCQSPT
jgi:hypothetical protein